MFIYLWKWKYLYTFKKPSRLICFYYELGPHNNVNLLPYKVFGAFLSQQYGPWFRLSPCCHFCLQLQRDEGPLEWAMSVVLGLVVPSEEKSCPVRPLWISINGSIKAWQPISVPSAPEVFWRCGTLIVNLLDWPPALPPQHFLLVIGFLALPSILATWMALSPSVMSRSGYKLQMWSGQP